MVVVIFTTGGLGGDGNGVCSGRVDCFVVVGGGGCGSGDFCAGDMLVVMLVVVLVLHVVVVEMEIVVVVVVWIGVLLLC